MLKDTFRSQVLRNYSKKDSPYLLSGDSLSKSQSSEV